MLGLITGMGIMAGNTTSAFFTVHMKEMEVILTVTEVSESFGIFFLGYIFIMTAKTEIIIL